MGVKRRRGQSTAEASARKEAPVVMPPEDLRCRRSDGKSWRCSGWRIHDKKLCEKHYLQSLGMRAKTKKESLASSEGSKGEEKGLEDSKDRDGGKGGGFNVNKSRRFGLGSGSRSQKRGRGRHDEEEERGPVERGESSNGIGSGIKKQKIEENKWGDEAWWKSGGYISDEGQHYKVWRNSIGYISE